MMATMNLDLMPPVEEMYDALVQRDSHYEGVFVVGVITTGVFCRPTCPARKPKPENVRYFATCRDALQAGFRPCKRCHPMEMVGVHPEWVRELLQAVESDPARAWRDDDLRQHGLEPARVRRWFKQHHGMTFHAYQRARRLGEALGRIQLGDDSMEAGFSAGYESSSGFRDAFAKLFGTPPGRAKSTTRLVVNRVPTPLGPMIAAASQSHLFLLEFIDRRMLQTQIDRLHRLFDVHFVPGECELLTKVQNQLADYFARRRQTFDLPLSLRGTSFQQAVWEQLLTIPYGATRSYGEQASAIGRPSAVRAVGRANGDNRIAIIVPCHRVIGANGTMTGYGGQVWRKQALLRLEQGHPLPHPRPSHHVAMASSV